MVELLATFGAAAKELFDYNREMYQFDQGQRLDRELLRLEMQIKRFQLFREDVRDLVELTVAKMEMYHVVGALVLECTVIYYTEGRIRTSAPPFLLGLYWLSAAGTFTYVLLCVWFSMYASISSHSFGVRLLTRFVRLPIPGSQQMSAMNARLTDFERQGGNIMRIPFMQGVPQWQQRRKDAGKNPSSTGQGEGDDEYLTAVVKPGEMKQQDLLESGVPGYADDEGVLQQAAVNLPGKHIKLFRELQAKWQCYDAYARVCMSFGVNHICMTMSYYMIGLTVLEYRSPSIMFALVTVFQATNLALAWLDVAGLKRKTTTFLEFIGAVPPFLTCFCMACAPYEEAGRGQFDPEHEFPYASVSFFITAIWLEGLLHLAWPSEDLAMLPKRFRSVLFLDVFGMADDVKAGEDTNAGQPLVEISREDAEAADEALSLAEAAVRRWNALPMGTEEAQKHQAEIQRLYAQAFTWRKVLNGEAAKRAAARGDFHELDLLEPDMRSWNRLTEEEKEEDPFADSLLGPFVNQHNETYYYHLESMEFVWKPEDDQGVLSLTQVSTLVKDAEQTVTDLFHGREDLIRSEDSDLELNTRTMIVESCFYVLRCCNKRRRPMERERRLPWRVLLSVTRVSQLSWLLLGLSILGQNTGLLPKFDLVVEKSKEEMESSESSEHKDGESERRLQAEDWDVFSMNGSALPKGLVSAMSCHPASEGCNLHLTTRVKTDGSSSVWNASTFASTTVSFEAAKNISLSSISSSILCPDNEALDPCFLDVVGDGLKLRTQKEDLEVSASLMPDVRLMQKISGAVLRCKILKLGEDISGSEWCLLFAGWDGRRLPVAVVPFPQSLGNGAKATTSVLPLFDLLANTIPQPCLAEISSLSMEANTGKLLVLWSNGILDAFDLLKGHHLGSWRPPWQPRSVSFNTQGQACMEQCSLQASPELWKALGRLKKVNAMGCGVPR
ncbi:unnamed protein product [Cladocopium goreaui]|uniref:Ammonium transporter 1 member 1 n=1 Tax=Cladocopium goreaui TaxID=2562237 RepID=A0A9P1DQ68_9DINO|nr:unnamed protein product [Cladocopium goreaui]